MSFTKTYRANGKLLLTGEYLVLHGAKAIALPLKVGQRLTVSKPNESKSFTWQAFYDGKIWFSCELNPMDFSVLKTSHPGKAETLSQLFKTIKSINPEFQPKSGTRFETALDANPEWGFGSSSTLVSLLSQWAGSDPFKLNEMVFKGSGFDVACAHADGPVFYTRNQPVQPINLDYPFADQLFLVYSGQKKGTENEVKAFLKQNKVDPNLMDEISALSVEFANSKIQQEFNRLIRIHEQLIGSIIGKMPVKKASFQDFDGEIKSLGAWGGDFYLVSGEMSFEELKKYFKHKGLTTVLRWNDLILNRK